MTAPTTPHGSIEPTPMTKAELLAEAEGCRRLATRARNEAKKERDRGTAAALRLFAREAERSAREYERKANVVADEARG